MSSPKRPVSSPTSQSSKRRHVYTSADGEMQEELRDRAPRKTTTVGETQIQGPNISASLSTEFEYILRHHISLAAPIISLLDWYLRLWNCYIVDSGLKIQLEEEQGQLQRLIACLTTECDALLQCCNDQALELFGRRQAASALNDGIVEVLKASEKRAYKMI